MASDKSYATEQRLSAMLAGAMVMVNPGIWAPATWAAQTPPSGAVGWALVNAFTANGWAAVSGEQKPAVIPVSSPPNSVFFVGFMATSLTHLANGTQILNQLPSWAWPQNCGQRIQCGTSGGSSANNTSYLFVSTSGIVECESVVAGTTSVGWSAVYSLDSPAAP
jgi:hypothetical protein